MPSIRVSAVLGSIVDVEPQLMLTIPRPTKCTSTKKVFAGYICSPSPVLGKPTYTFPVLHFFRTVIIRTRLYRYLRRCVSTLLTHCDVTCMLAYNNYSASTLASLLSTVQGKLCSCSYRLPCTP